MRRTGSFAASIVRAIAVVAALLALSPQVAAASQVNYTYDALGRLASETDSDGTTLIFSYDAAGNRTQYVIGALAAPVAGAVSATVTQNSFNNPITLSLTGGAAASVAVSTAASHGTAAASGTSISYTPTSGYSGADSFYYTASNATGTSSAALASITVAASIHVSPNPTWAGIYAYAGSGTAVGSDAAQTISGIGTTITLKFNIAPDQAGGTFSYSKNGGSWTTWTSGTTVTAVNGDTFRFQISRTPVNAAFGTINILNLTDSSTLLCAIDYDVEAGT